MPKYLITASYTAEGVKGLARDGGTKRRQAAEAASLAVNASGAVQASTVVLLTPEEMDQAAKKTVAYTPPGR